MAAGIDGLQFVSLITNWLERAFQDWTLPRTPAILSGVVGRRATVPVGFARQSL